MSWDTLISELLHGLPFSSSCGSSSSLSQMYKHEYISNGLEWNGLFPVLLLFIFCKDLHFRCLFSLPALLLPRQRFCRVGFCPILRSQDSLCFQWSWCYNLTASAVVLCILYSYITMLPAFLRAHLAFSCVTVSSNRRVYWQLDVFLGR